MKISLKIFLPIFFLTALTAYFLGKNSQQTTIFQDKNWQKFIQKNLECQSFTAYSYLYEKGKKSGQTNFKLVDDGWQLTLLDPDSLALERPASLSAWLKLGKEIYILDFRDNQWWQSSHAPVRLLSALDFRNYLKLLADPKNNFLEVRFLKRDLCEEKFCLQYEIIDKHIQFPGRNLLSHYLWFDEEDYLLKKEEYLNGSGDISLTEYFNCNQTVIEKPSKSKQVAEEKDIFMLPGTIFKAKGNEFWPKPAVVPFFY